MMAKPRVPVPDDDVQTAYKIHTIAQLLYARFVTAPGRTPFASAPFPPAIQ